MNGSWDLTPTTRTPATVLSAVLTKLGSTFWPSCFSSMVAMMMCEAFGVTYRTILGYGGSGEMMMGLIRGEADLIAISYSSIKALLDSKELQGIVKLTQGDTSIKLPDALDLAVKLNIPASRKAMLQSVANVMGVYRAVATSPGMSPVLAKMMRDAFDKAIADPGFLKSAKKANRPVIALNGVETQKLIVEAIEGLKRDPNTRRMVKKIFTGK